ncbi:MAG TPA: UvrD-helicase domain-containing protein [Solirubrobacterales bacterium]|nr:UvrD-helicase domain-containing protein [Solirubrobacterales bacterium]
MSTELETFRERICGPDPLLLIEAPAGYGKTHEAVHAAQQIAPTLPAGRKVLFLTHTNAARETFNRRLRGGAAVMKTIHSLAAEIVELYAAPFDLPRPLDPFHGRPPFRDMIKLATSVLGLRPEVALGLAARHPAILVDEYQDCDEDQHRFIQVIAEAAPTRLRLFGDDLQAIYDFDGTPVDFAAMIETSPNVRLTTPWRWRDDNEMRTFIVKARRALAAGEPVDLTDPPSCVTVGRWAGDVPGPGQEGYAPECIAALGPHLGGGTVVLTHHNVQALGLRKKLPRGGRYHEGADHEPARILLDEVIVAEGDYRQLVALLVKAMTDWGQGMAKTYRDQAVEICTTEGVEVGAKKKILPFSRLCEDLYADPTVTQWLGCIRTVLAGDHGIDGWRVLRGDQLYLLSRLRPGPEDDASALLHAEARARDAIRPAPRKGFMVIHKAKGLEFEAVALPYCAGAFFKDDLPSRRRLYVAISRAQRRIHFLIPESDPTPLLRA